MDEIEELMNFTENQRTIRLTKGYVHAERDASTRDASELLIINPLEKMRHETHFIIGGTRTENRTDFWFHSTTACIGQTYLLSVFIRVSWPGQYVVRYVSTSKLLLKGDLSREKCTVVGYGDLKERSFKTVSDNEEVYLMTYQFGPIIKEYFQYCKILVIPFSIKTLMPMRLLNYYKRRLMDEKMVDTDFTVISSTNVKHSIHATFLEEHSPKVLKPLVQRALSAGERELVLDITDHEMLVFTEYIYANEIFTALDYLDIVKLVAKYDLTKLYYWILSNLRQNVCYANACVIAKLAVKHGWKEMLEILIQYVKYSPEMLHTFGTKDEDDKKILDVLVKHLFCEENINSAFFYPVFIDEI